MVKQLAQGYTAVQVAEQWALPGPHLPCCTVNMKVFSNKKDFIQTPRSKLHSLFEEEGAKAQRG